MVVTCEQWAMGHHGILFAKSYGLKFVSINASGDYDDIYQLGIFSESALNNITKRKKGRIVLHWCGSDAFGYERRVRKGKWKNRFPNFVEHVAQSQRQVDVLRQFGIYARVVKRFCDRRENYPLTPLPEKFTVLIFTPYNGRSVTFNFDKLARIIEACQDMYFILFGEADRPKQKLEVNTDNITRVKWISLVDRPEEYRSVLKNCSCLLRFKNKTEGFSQMMMQVLLLGRRVLSNVDQEYVEKFSIDDVQSIINRLKELKEIKEPYVEGSNYYHTREDINNFDFIK